MRFYPNADINHYWEIPPGWSLYTRDPLKSWKRDPLQSKHAIAHWRDLDAAKMSQILQKDLHFEDWPRTRIRPEACLPQYYCVGNRFIRLQKAFPAGFKCAPLPMSLKEVREIDAFEKQMAKEKRAKAKEAKQLAKEKAKLERKKKGIRE